MTARPGTPRCAPSWAGGPDVVDVANEQVFDYDGLEGRLLSSYAPKAGHPEHDPMIRELRDLFEVHREDGVVRFGYVTRLFVGTLGATS